MAIKKIKLDKIEHISFEVPNKRMTVTEAYNTFKFNGRKPTHIINGTLFNMDLSSNSTITFGKSNGKSIGYIFDNEGICLDNKSVKWNTLSNTKDSIICGSPRLLKNGITDINWGNKVSSYLKNPAIRTAIGINNDSLFLFVGSVSQTLEQLSKYMKDNGCTHALNLDGGGSTCGYFDNKLVRNTSRKLANFICVWEKEDVKGEEIVNKQYTIFVDSGHGQTDSGAVGRVLGLKEKDVVLKLSKFLESELVRQNIKVYQTRTDDKRLFDNDKAKDLSARCKKANDLKADYFVSLHTNSATNTSAKGIETFSFAKTGNGSNLAHAVQLELDKLGRPSRGKKEANFAVLRETNMSAILIELCFISNEEEEKLLSSDEFLNKSAILIAKGICKHLNIIYKEKEEPKQQEGEEMDKKYPSDLSDWAKTAYDFVVDSGISDGKNPKSTITAERLWGMLYKLDQYYKNK